MNGVIVYFPWGAAGNLVKNIINLDTRFEFLDDQAFAGTYPTVDSRYHWLLNYYQQPMEPDLWLPREWSIRAKMHARYYVNSQITYWNPDYLISYDVHGDAKELESLLANTTLKQYDREGVERGLTLEQDSSWGLLDCEHVFLLPDNIKIITEVYNSKNPTINQLENEGDLPYRQQEALTINTTMTTRLRDLQTLYDRQGVKHYDYVADDLYRNADIVLDISNKLGLTIPEEYVTMIHQAWLDSTQAVYKKYFNRELDI